MPSSTPLTYLDSWQCMTPAEAQAVQAFWLRENAHVEGAEAERRVREVVVRVVAPDGQLVAVATAQPRLIPRLMQPMYYYRCFVGAAWRSGRTRHLRTLLLKAIDVLEEWASTRGFPCIGVVLELENDGFANALQRAYWSNGSRNGFTFIGRSARGLDMRVRYFAGARLKSAEEIDALLRAADAHSAADDSPAGPDCADAQ